MQLSSQSRDTARCRRRVAIRNWVRVVSMNATSSGSLGRGRDIAAGGLEPRSHRHQLRKLRGKLQGGAPLAAQEVAGLPSRHTHLTSELGEGPPAVVALVGEYLGAARAVFASGRWEGPHAGTLS